MWTFSDEQMRVLVQLALLLNPIAFEECIQLPGYFNLAMNQFDGKLLGAWGTVGQPAGAGLSFGGLFIFLLCCLFSLFPRAPLIDFLPSTSPYHFLTIDNLYTMYIPLP